METQGYGSGGDCICVRCNVRLAHVAGTPCRKMRCPECGKAMVRENSIHHKILKTKLKNKNNDNE